MNKSELKSQRTIDKETFEALKQANQQKSVYRLVYKDDLKRPAYFSFHTIIKYKEVITLICFITFQNAANDIQMALAKQRRDPGDYAMEPWVIGSAVGIFLLSIISDCIFKNTQLFTPIAACLLF